MLLYIIRHGDPDYEHNTVTAFGHKEAKALADWFEEKQIRFDEIYVSPLGRAKDTAAYTCQAQNIRPTELPWTAESMDYMQPFPPASSVSFRFTANGVEDYTDFSEEDRMDSIQTLMTESDAFLKKAGYERIGSHYRCIRHNTKRIAVFCHGGFGTAWTAYLLGTAPTLGFSSMFMTTTSMNVFEFSPCGNSDFTRPRMLRFGDVPHLHRVDLADDRA